MHHQKDIRVRKPGRRFLVIAGLLVAWVLTASQDPTPQGKEYAIKAAFICQMVKFVTWPKDKPVDANNVVTITIIGPNRFGNLFESAKTQLFKDKTLVIKEAKLLTPPTEGDAVQKVVWEAYIQSLRTSHMIYLVGAPNEDLTPLLTALQPAGVLVLGECEGCTDKGVMVNFLPGHEKIRFEVNLIATRAARIQISSKVLRLASRIIEKQGPDTRPR